MDVVLVRHGSTSWSGRRYCGRSDTPLSAAGVQEAELAARRLAPTLSATARIVSSPSRRAVATAEAIARATGGRSVEQDPRWLETDFGEAEGLLFDELAERFPELATLVL
ncbi:MAG TPA: histidine phosphatase family protein, partial [Solirubrobacterales bacterium]|nr:histidine phosphatase family protein [Solirubrobacterales bacterium]